MTETGPGPPVQVRRRACGGRLGTVDPTTVSDLLHARRTTLVAELAQVDLDLDAARTAKTDGTDDDEHDPEGATTSTQWSHATGMRAAIRAQVEEVDLALERLAHGTYGACTRCGRPVGGERLEVRPSAQHCIDCARELSR